MALLSQAGDETAAPISADRSHAAGVAGVTVGVAKRGSTLLRPAMALLAKELRTEFRTRELLATTLVFVLMVLVLFSFTFDPTAAETRRFAPGLLWLALLFAGSLMLHPSFTREQANDTLAALRLAPIEPMAILVAKIAANLCFLLVAELLLLPIFAALYNLSLLPVIGRLAAVLFLGNAGTRDDWDGILGGVVAGANAGTAVAAAVAAADGPGTDRERRSDRRLV